MSLRLKRRALPAIDAAVAAWALIWIGVGIAIGFEVRSLNQLATTVARDGRAVEQVGRSLHALGAGPVRRW